MKAIFLDVDGTLTSNKSKSLPKTKLPWGRPEEKLVDAFDQDCVACLKQIVAASGASIVISSSWREREGFDLETLTKHFKNYGLDIIDTTPILNDHRGKEIQAWLNKHPVERFIILDDYNDMVHLAQFLIKVDWRTGISDENVVVAIQMLS